MEATDASAAANHVDDVEIQYLKLIGKGSYGEVWKARWNCQIVAAKKLDDKYFVPNAYDTEIKNRRIEEIKRESQVLQTLIHPNILRMYAVLFPEHHSPIIITELLHCDLKTYIETSQTDPKVPANSLKIVSLGIAEGLVYLHGLELPVAHRDISTKNILLSRDGNPKIADLGVAKVFRMEDDDYATANTGTPIYSAPETIGRDPHLKYLVMCDVFSFGVVLMTMINGHEPYPRTPNVKGRRMSDKDRRKKDIDEMGNHALKPLVLDCLHDKPSKRPTAKVIIQRLGKVVHHLSDSHREREEKEISNSLARNTHDTAKMEEKCQFERIPAEHRYDYRFKVLLIGNTAVGKTCLVNKICNPEFDHINTVTTLGVEPHKQAFRYFTKTVEMQITDTAGQEQFFAIQPLYFRNIDGIFFVYDVMSSITFQRLPYWLHFAKPYCDKSHFVIVANKVDCTSPKRAISREDGQAFADKCGYPYIETSATPDYYHTILAMYEKMVESLIKRADPEDINIEVRDRNTSTINIGQPQRTRSRCRCNRS